MKIEKMTLIGHSLGEQELRNLVSLKGRVLIATLLVDSRRIPEHGVRAEVPCEPFVAAFTGNSSLHPSPTPAAFPQSRVDRLILLSPAGIPDYNDTPDSDTPNPASVNAARELAESQKQTTGGKPPHESEGSRTVTANQAAVLNNDTKSATAKHTQGDKKATDRKGNPPPRLGRCECYCLGSVSYGG
jgi:hypothetical protein